MWDCCIGRSDGGEERRKEEGGPEKETSNSTQGVYFPSGRHNRIDKGI